VPKEELLNKVWPGVIVTDASLQRAVSLARTSLEKLGAPDANPDACAAGVSISRGGQRGPRATN
jgi:hypothetical protein